MPLGPLLGWQAALALCLIAWVVGPAWLPAAGAVLVAVVLATVVHAGPRPLWRQLRVRSRYRARRRAARRPPASDGFPLARHESLVPMLHLRPALTVTEATGRTGEPAGVVCDGDGFCAILGPADEPLVPAFVPVSFGIGVLADLCDADGVDLDSAQLVIRVRPSPDRDVTAVAPAVAQSYAEINRAGAPAAVSWLLAVRLDPTASSAVLDVGTAGDMANRMRASANRAAKALGAAGLSCRMLGEREVVSALAAAVDADRRRPRPARPRVQERSGSVLVDGLAHQVGWLRGFGTGSPDGLTGLLAMLADVDATAATVSVVVTVTEQRRLRTSAYVRLTAPTPAQCTAAMRSLRKRVRSLGAALVPLAAEQAPGLLATVPLGGDVV